MSMDRNMALELVRATEAAALSSARMMGRGDETAADQAAVNAMRAALNQIDMNGTVACSSIWSSESSTACRGSSARRPREPIHSTSPI